MKNNLSTRNWIMIVLGVLILIVGYNNVTTNGVTLFGFVALGIVLLLFAGIITAINLKKKKAKSPDENTVKKKKSWVMTPLFPLTKWLFALACLYMVGMFYYLANVTTTVLPVSAEGETSFKLTETYYTFKLKADQDIQYHIPPYGGLMRKSGSSAPESSSGYEGHGTQILVQGNGPTSYVKLLQYNHIYLENLFPLYSWL